MLVGQNPNSVLEQGLTNGKFPVATVIFRVAVGPCVFPTPSWCAVMTAENSPYYSSSGGVRPSGMPVPRVRVVTCVTWLACVTFPFPRTNREATCCDRTHNLCLCGVVVTKDILNKQKDHPSGGVQAGLEVKNFLGCNQAWQLLRTWTRHPQLHVFKFGHFIPYSIILFCSGCGSYDLVAFPICLQHVWPALTFHYGCVCLPNIELEIIIVWQYGWVDGMCGLVFVCGSGISVWWTLTCQLLGGGGKLASGLPSWALILFQHIIIILFLYLFCLCCCVYALSIYCSLS